MTKSINSRPILTYIPQPINTDDVVLPPELSELSEILAKNVHETWAYERMKEGWTYGAQRDDLKKQTPCFVPYEFLPESEKEYDRKTVSAILKMSLKLGFNFSRP